MNQTQSTIQKIEESLANQEYDYSNKPDTMMKFSKIIWTILGIVLLITVLITLTGWLTLETEPVNYQNTVKTNY
jgi:hypothetical protein